MTKPFTAKEADMSPDKDQRRGLIRARKMLDDFACRLETDENATCKSGIRTHTPSSR